MFRGSPAEIAAQKKRKAVEMKIFNEMAESMQKKDKETFLKVLAYSFGLKNYYYVELVIS